jgi:hypothetical protein
VSPVWRSYSSAIPPLKPIRERRDWDITVTSSTLWKSEMRVIVATFMGLVALAVAPVQAAPNPDKDNWVQLGAARSFELGDQACGVGRHRTIDRSYLPFLDDKKPRAKDRDLVRNRRVGRIGLPRVIGGQAALYDCYCLGAVWSPTSLAPDEFVPTSRRRSLTNSGRTALAAGTRPHAPFRSLPDTGLGRTQPKERRMWWRKAFAHECPISSRRSAESGPS